MNLEEHEAESIKLFGKPFTEVHQWLDALASHGSDSFDVNHRRWRHNMVGIRKVEEMWGREAREAAIRHIRSDFHRWGWEETLGIPEDMEGYIRMFGMVKISPTIKADLEHLLELKAKGIKTKRYDY